MVLVWCIFISLNLLVVNGQWIQSTNTIKSKGFIKTTALYFDVIQSSSQPKSLIECCGYCGTIETCQGVKYEGNNCTAINNILPNFRATKDNYAWIDLELYSRTRKLILFSGSTKSTEIIDLSFESSHLLANTFPASIGAKISDAETMICQPTSSNCGYFETVKPHEFTPLTQFLTGPRENAAAIGLPEKEGLWIIGGETATTDEIITKGGSQPGPPSPEVDTKKHCVVRINSTTVFSIGGRKGETLSKKTWLCHMTSDQPENWKWIEGPILNRARMDHACATWNVNDKIIVTVVSGYGRVSGENVHFTSTELLEMETNNWIYGPEIPLGLKNPSMTQVSLDKQNELYLFGGNDPEAKAEVNTIQKLSCEDQNDLNTCQWITLPQKLQIPRSSGIVIQL